MILAPRLAAGYGILRWLRGRWGLGRGPVGCGMMTFVELRCCIAEQSSSMEAVVHATIEVGGGQDDGVPWHAKHAWLRDEREGKRGNRFMVQGRILA